MIKENVIDSRNGPTEPNTPVRIVNNNLEQLKQEVHMLRQKDIKFSESFLLSRNTNQESTTQPAQTGVKTADQEYAGGNKHASQDQEDYQHLVSIEKSNSPSVPSPPQSVRKKRI